MNETRDSRLPPGIIWLLIYQWALVAGCLAYSASAALVLVGNTRSWDVVLGLLGVLVLASWGTALGFASVGIARRRPQGYLLGMICHLLLEIPGLPAVLVFVGMYVLMSLSNSESSRAWAPLMLLFGLMWLPFVVFSAWAFFYLRRLRKGLLS